MISRLCLVVFTYKNTSGGLSQGNMQFVTDCEVKDWKEIDLDKIEDKIESRLNLTDKSSLVITNIIQLGEVDGA